MKEIKIVYNAEDVNNDKNNQLDKWSSLYFEAYLSIKGNLDEKSQKMQNCVIFVSLVLLWGILKGRLFTMINIEDYEKTMQTYVEKFDKWEFGDMDYVLSPKMFILLWNTV